MFEKEAEEYAKKLLNPSLEYAFKDGAEFGYNKANELHRDLPTKDIKDKSEVIRQLAQAKELLTRFVIASVYFNGKEADLVERAEQFLNSEEGWEFLLGKK